jgi:photosystem II stability/assembly factor-like uncharacterized protein
MRRILLALALVLALTGCGSSARGVPHDFRAETAAAFGPSDLWILGRGNTLVRSTDGGAHFEQVSSPPLRTVGNGPSVVFANANDGFAYARDGGLLYATHDGGRSWSASLGAVSNVAVGGGHVFATTRRHGLERSPVGGGAWTELPAAHVQRASASIAVEGSRLWLLGAPRRARDADTIQFSSDSGRTFTSYRGPCYFDLPGRLVPSGGGDVWAVCPSGMMASLLRSTDGGRTFPLTRSFRGPLSERPPLLTNGAQIFPLSRDAAVVYPGVGAPIYWTADAGERWTRAGESWTQAHAPFWLGFPTDRFGYALGLTKLWRTTDAGRSWHAVPLS